MPKQACRKLLSFLGRGPYNPAGGTRGGYRETRYDFAIREDTLLSSKHSVIALAAIEAWQKNINQSFDSVVIFGTSGSMWDNLLLSFFSQYQLDIPEEIYALEPQVDEMTVTAEMLKPFAEMLSASTDLHVDFQVITDATTKEKQAKLLQQIDQSVEKNDKVVLDVTHGYRHLPILGLAAAKLISATKNAEILDVIYGALDQQVDGKTPVVSLIWVLNLFSVISGMDEMSRCRNMRPLIKCFPPSLLREKLDQASYKLDVMRTEEAGRAAHQSLDAFHEEQGNLPIELELITQPLMDNLRQFKEFERNTPDLLRMAHRAVEEQDYLRCAIFLAEAIDLNREQQINSDKRADRKLKCVRNWMAHAGELQDVSKREMREIMEVVASRKSLRSFLMKNIDRLSAGQPKRQSK